MRAGPKNLERYAAAQLEARLKKLGTNLRRTAKDSADADKVHDLRVAIRRFTQALRVFDHVLSHGRARAMKRKIGKVMDLCGETRNCDIAIQTLTAAGVRVNGSLKHSLAKSRSHAAADLEDKLKDFKIQTKIHTWREWLEPQAGPSQTIASAAKRILRPLAKDFLSAGAVAVAPDSTPEEMHRFRLLSKRLRYTLEIFGPVAGSESNRAIGAVRELQEYLGAVNDCVASADLLAQLGESGHVARPAKSALRHLLRQRVEAFRRYWQERWTPKEKRWWQDWIRRIE